MNINLEKYSTLVNSQVSRETNLDFEKFILLILKKNKKINIISKETEINIRERHIIDCAQAVDLIDFNDNTCTDLGSGGGMPGIVLAIIVKHLKYNMTFNLYEKSYHKSIFLEEVVKKLNLNVNIFQKDVFKTEIINSDIIIARAFKPISVILDLVNKNFKNYKNLILFMGASGKKSLQNSLMDWELDYKEKKSKTSNDSFLLSIKNIKKK